MFWPRVDHRDNRSFRLFAGGATTFSVFSLDQVKNRRCLFGADETTNDRLNGTSDVGYRLAFTG